MIAPELLAEYPELCERLEDLRALHDEHIDGLKSGCFSTDHAEAVAMTVAIVAGDIRTIEQELCIP